MHKVTGWRFGGTTNLQKNKLKVLLTLIKHIFEQFMKK